MCSIYCQLSGIALVFGYVTCGCNGRVAGRDNTTEWSDFFQLAGFEKPFLAALVV
jgi:hypothetical protein